MKMAKTENAKARLLAGSVAWKLMAMVVKWKWQAKIWKIVMKAKAKKKKTDDEERNRIGWPAGWLKMLSENLKKETIRLKMKNDEE